jgi:hypothetical protein
MSLGFILLTAVCPVGAMAERDRGTQRESRAPAWHQQLAELARASIADVEEHADVAWRKFYRKMGFDKPRHIAAYRGYANDKTLWVSGRLLANKPYGGPQDDDNWWDNLRATYGRWESDEIPDAKLTLAYGKQRQQVITDDEGYYQVSFTIDSDTPLTDHVRAEYRDGKRMLSAEHWVMVPDPDARFLIVSDMDDTVIHTGITNLLLAAQLTFLNNAKTRKPLTGVGALYQNLTSAGSSTNPIIYLSNSAWNMYDLLRDENAAENTADNDDRRQ